MNVDAMLWELKREAKGYWARRIAAELDFLRETYRQEGAEPPALYARAVENLWADAREQDAVTKAAALAAEQALAPLSSRAKALTILCAAHAHIDMNWQWGFDETVGVTIDTFQTMLNLMDEYPQFTFSQSQAAVYEIVEKYAPGLLEPIRRRVREGRWEVTASTWVENDKNMSGTEAMARHLLYTKRYLSGLLGVDADDLDLDFEPDTFGHAAHLPEILQKGGVKYYYQCRGNGGKRAYRWRAPSGAEVIAYCEPNWYLGPIEYGMFSFVPGFCKENHTDTALCVYGVGDHGGGPTRRDLERILDMSTWPLMANIRFGAIRAFFQALEKSRAQLPEVDGELNYVFTGCYTSQSRLKQANRHGEDRLADAEAICAMAQIALGKKSEGQPFEAGWRRVLFNQFHDILPGSCVREAREHALGRFQEASACALSNANRALKALGDQIDTSGQGGGADPASTAEGAGAGMNNNKNSALERAFAGGTFQVTSAARSGGKVRAFTLFNPTQYARREVVELTIWDWPQALYNTRLVDFEGRELSFQTVEEGREYWQHRFDRIAFACDLPAYGYANYYVLASETPVDGPKRDEPRVHDMQDVDYVLENDLVRAAFDHRTLKLKSFFDKRSKAELIQAGRPSGYFRLVEERGEDMSAWVVGGCAKAVDLNETCAVEVRKECLQGIRRFIDYEIAFGQSRVLVRVSLDEHSNLLRYSIDLDWHEISRKDGLVPQLQFALHPGYAASQLRCDVPGGYVDREKLGHDVPAILYAAPLDEAGGGCLMLTTDCKYGYRFSDEDLHVTLLRASNLPDPYPESGVNQIEIGVAACASGGWAELTRCATLFSHPVYPYSNGIHAGALPQRRSLLRVEGARVCGLKASEDGNGLIVRLLNGGEERVQARVAPAADLRSAVLTDIEERPQKAAGLSGGEAAVALAPCALETLRLELAQKE